MRKGAQERAERPKEATTSRKTGGLPTAQQNLVNTARNQTSHEPPGGGQGKQECLALGARPIGGLSRKNIPTNGRKSRQNDRRAIRDFLRPVA